MTLVDLVEEFASTRAPGWIVLQPIEMTQCAVEAARYYAAYGDIKSLSGSDPLPAASGSPTPIVYPPMQPIMLGYAALPGIAYSLPSTPSVSTDPIIADALPIKDAEMVNEDTEISVGEWAIIKPLFFLYVERENAQRLEASRALGLEVYGRSTSEINGDIATMENDTLPSKAAFAVAIEV